MLEITVEVITSDVILTFYILNLQKENFITRQQSKQFGYNCSGIIVRICKVMDVCLNFCNVL
jgi:hypothetical protein